MALITKLDSPVSDEELLKLGELEIRISNAANNFTMSMSGNATIHCEIIGNGNFFTNNTYSTSAGKSVDVLAGGSAFCSTGTYKIRVRSKYNLENIGFSSFIIPAFADFGKLEDFSFAANTRQLGFYNQAIVGDVGCLTNKPALATVVMEGGSITGDITSFAKSTSLAVLFLERSSVQGTLESLLDAMVSNGRTSGTMSINLRSSGVTYNGAPITSVLTASFSESGWVVS